MNQTHTYGLNVKITDMYDINFQCPEQTRNNALGKQRGKKGQSAVETHSV